MNIERTPGDGYAALAICAELVWIADMIARFLA